MSAAAAVGRHVVMTLGVVVLAGALALALVGAVLLGLAFLAAVAVVEVWSL